MYILVDEYGTQVVAHTLTQNILNDLAGGYYASCTQVEFTDTRIYTWDIDSDGNKHYELKEIN